MEKEKNKKVFSCLFKGILIFFAVVALLYGGFIFIFTYNPHYTWFTKNRKAEMEEKYNITITDNIKLHEYKEYGMLANIDYVLYLYADDLGKFMEENVNGTITEKYDDNDFSYKGTDGEKVFVSVTKYDNEDRYRISLSMRN